MGYLVPKIIMNPTADLYRLRSWHAIKSSETANPTNLDRNGRPWTHVDVSTRCDNQTRSTARGQQLWILTAGAVENIECWLQLGCGNLAPTGMAAPVDGTCQWIFSDSNYRKWIGEAGQAAPAAHNGGDVLLVVGPAGE